MLNKCYELQFNFDLLIHSMLNSLCTNVVPLDIAIHVVSLFLVEGQKTLFRFMYAAIKCNKDFFVQLESKEELVKKLKANSWQSMALADFIKFSY